MYRVTWSLSQDGTSEIDQAEDCAVGADGSIFLVGYTYGDWEGPNAGGADVAVLKLDSDGNEQWRWQVSRTRPDASDFHCQEGAQSNAHNC